MNLFSSSLTAMVPAAGRKIILALIILIVGTNPYQKHFENAREEQTAT